MTYLQRAIIVIAVAIMATVSLVTPAQAQSRGARPAGSTNCDPTQVRVRMIPVTGTTKVAGDTQAVNLVFSGPINGNDVLAIRFDYLENASVGFQRATDYQGTGVVHPYPQNQPRSIHFMMMRFVNERSTVYFTVFHRCGEFRSFYSRPRS